MSVLVNALIIFIINYLFCLLCNLKLNLTEICFKIMNIFQNALTGQKKHILLYVKGVTYVVSVAVFGIRKHCNHTDKLTRKQTQKYSFEMKNFLLCILG